MEFDYLRERQPAYLDHQTPRRTVRLLDRNDAARLRQPPKLVHELSIPADWREEDAGRS
jgi:hypothetical protein